MVTSTTTDKKRGASLTSIPFSARLELGNPAEGPQADLTFHAQSAFVLEVDASVGHFIFIGDRWNPNNLVDSRYVWLPLTFAAGRFSMLWQDEWDLSFF